MVTKLKFKMKTIDLLAFNDACSELFLQCPQTMPEDIPFTDRSIFTKEVTAKQIVKYWKKEPVLHEYGYYNKDTLYEEFEIAENVFALFNAYKTQKKLQGLNNDN